MDLVSKINLLTEEDREKFFAELSLKYPNLYHTSNTYRVKCGQICNDYYNGENIERHTMIMKASTYEGVIELISKNEYFRGLFLYTDAFQSDEIKYIVVDEYEGDMWCCLCGREVKCIDDSSRLRKNFDCGHTRYTILNDEDWIKIVRFCLKHSLYTGLLTVKKIDVDGISYHDKYDSKYAKI